MLTFRSLLLFSAALFIPMHLAAQDGRLSRGTSEVTGFGGIADGEGTFGGSFGKAVTDRVFVYGEASYLGGGSDSVAGISVSAKAYNFNGGVHYNFLSRSKLVPYAGAGLGVTRASVKASAGGISGGGSDSAFLLNFGGGARYYAGKNWGFRPELMVFAGDGSYVRFSVGVFFQF